MEIRESAGDIVLYRRIGESPLSLGGIIRRVTGSDFTHSALVSAPGWVTDANPQEGADITEFPLADLVSDIGGDDQRDRAVLLRRLTPIDSAALRIAVDAMKESAGQTPPAGEHPASFSVADLAGFAFARILAPPQDPYRRRLLNAVLSVTNAKNGEMFCSEYVYRVLQNAGAAPELPARMVVDLSDYPTDETMPGLSSWVSRMKLWWEMSGVPTLVDLVREHGDEMTGFLKAVRRAYLDEVPAPARLQIANFVAPVDLANSANYRILAWANRGAPTWTPVDDASTA